MIHVLLLAFNEEEGIGACLTRLEEILRPRGEPYRYVVVDDGSRDRTAERVRALAASLPITLLQHPTNLGVARGFNTGLRHIVETAGPDDIVVTMEGDRTNDPRRLPEMFDRIRRGADVVCASRYRAGGEYVGFPLRRRLISLGANWSMRLFFPVDGVRDFTIFFRAYRASALAAAIRRFGDRFIERNGFSSNAEILFKAASASRIRASEVPLVYRYDLKKGGSKMKVGSNMREYGTLFRALAALPVGAGLRQTAAFAALTLALGLAGLGWGLPRLEWRNVLPEALRADPGFLRQLAEGRAELYRRLEEHGRMPVDFVARALEVPAHWTEPPPALMNSFRSFYLRSENADEQKNLTYLAHMKPRELNFEPYAASYGGAYIYALGAWYAAAASLRAVRVTSDVAYYLADPSRIAAVFKAGRLLNVLAFAGCAGLLASLARASAAGSAATSALSGWLAGLLFLTLPVAAIVSHTTNPYGWATLWALVMFRFVFRYLERGEEGDLLKAAAAFGVCFGSSIAFYSASLAMPLACLLRVRGGSAWRAELGALVKAALLAWLVFLLTNPYLFLKFRVYRDEMMFELTSFPFGLSWDRMRDFFLEFMGFNMGLLLSALALGLALYQGLRRGVRHPIRLAAWMFLLGYFQLALRIADPAHGRHFLPFLALGCLLVADFTAEAFAPEGGAALLRWPAGLLMAGALVLNGAAGATYLWNMSLEARGRSTRLEAADWIDRNLPDGSSIGLNAPPQPFNTPPFRFDRHALVLFGEPRQLAGRALPDYFVTLEPASAGAMAEFLAANYTLARVFEAPRLFSWLPVRGLYSIVGETVAIYARK